MKLATCALLCFLAIPGTRPRAEEPLVTTVEFVGNSAVSAADLAKDLLIRAGKSLRQEDLERDRQTLLERYHGEGYLLADVRSDAIEKLPGHALLVWRISERHRVVVDEVNISGNEGVTPGEILSALRLPSGGVLSFLQRGYYQPAQVRRGLEALHGLYRYRGYFRASIELEDVRLDPSLRWVSLSIRAQEGPRFVLESVRLSGNRIFSVEHLLEVAAVQTGGFYSGAEIEAARNRLVRWYQEHSDSVALVQPQIQLLEGNRVVTTFKIREGEHRFVGQVIVDGNWKTRDRVIRQHLSVVPGAPLNMLEIEKSKERLEGLGYFEKVEWALRTTEDERIHDVVIRVEEKESTGRWELGGGASSGAGEVAYLRVQGVNMDLFRTPRSLADWKGAFVGGGQTLDLSVVPGNKESLFALRFHEPWLFSSHRTLSLEGRSMFVEREAYDENRQFGEIEIRQFLDRSHHLSFALAYVAEDVEIADLEASAPPDVTDVRGHTLLAYPRLSLRFDDLETNFYSGPAGLFGEARLDVADSPTGSELSFSRLTGSVDVFRTFFGDDPDYRHLLHAGLRAGWSSGLGGDPFPIFERFFVGGPRSFRGFYYRRLGPHDGRVPLGGRALLQGTVEYSFPLVFREARLVALFDWGNLEPSWGSFSTGRFRTAAGLGLQLRLPALGQIVPLNFYWTKALSSERGDKEQTFAFTLGYGF